MISQHSKSLITSLYPFSTINLRYPVKIVDFHMTFSDSNKLAISNSEDPRKIDCTSKHFVENSDIPFLL